VDHERVVQAGGLHIIGTERHDARRIDNQLRGRSGRQGDPGSSRFYLSLEDTLMKRFASDRVAGLMERMGLQDDVPIESGIVGKTIENAQTRVEGWNFDARKRVVEYDDVINKQRETIYAERDKVLRNEDLTATVRGFLDDEVETLVADHMVGEHVDDWDFDGLAKALAALGLQGPDATTRGLEEIGVREDITEALHENIDKALEEREKQYGSDVWAQVERFVLLRTIDTLWVEHLTELDDMRRGIGLRGYGGIDPLTEFKREAFKLYEELGGFIRRQVANTIFHVTVQAQPLPAAQPLPFNPAALAAANATSAGNVSATATTSTTATSTDGNGKRPAAAAAPAPAAIPPAVIPGMADQRQQRLQYSAGDEPVAAAANAGTARGDARSKLGRNDPCWCGSGKKYKRCHGA
jgi:preprotein translocase subunit SecA